MTHCAKNVILLLITTDKCKICLNLKRGDTLKNLFSIPKKKELDPIIEKEIQKHIKFFIKSLPQTLTPKDLERLLSFGKTKIYTLLRTDVIPAHKVSGKWIIPKAIFLKWYYTGEYVEIDLEKIKKAI